MKHIKKLIGGSTNDPFLNSIKDLLSSVIGRSVLTKTGSKVRVENGIIYIKDLNEEDSKQRVFLGAVKNG